jgi:hypothetical protein
MRAQAILSALSLTGVLLATTVEAAGPQAASPPPAPPVVGSTQPAVKTFGSPQQAADALVSAADRFDVRMLQELFGPEGYDVVLTGDYTMDRDRANKFAALAKGKMTVSVNPRNATRASLVVGNEDWPFPVPIVKRGQRWSFDARAGRQEILNRKVGENELDAITVSRGFVEAQHAYALKKREGYDVNQYAQRIISSPGKQDGLAWQLPDGSWAGPVGEQIARAIGEGHSASRLDPYHGYFFKVLKGQGPAAPLGQMDFVVGGAMIGGFALVAAPAEYRITGTKTFIVSHDGVVYEKDFGRATPDEFSKMERFNPDASWTPVGEE